MENPKVTDTHRALAESLARAVDRPGQGIEAIARKLAQDEAKERAEREDAERTADWLLTYSAFCD